MADRSRSRSRKRLFPNPFYVLLIITSTVFTITALAYLIGPTIVQQARQQPATATGRPGPGSLALAGWLDRTGPWVLGGELAVMLASSFLAMATDRWFPSKPPRQPPAPG
jgi:predicted PurR-regulated permease PerM